MMAYVVTQACVDVMDKSCMEECPVDCLYQGNRMMYINPIECVDCGACVPACPTQAIAYEGDLGPADKGFVTVNREVFLSIGNPGGARDFGLLGRDAELVSALPPQEKST